MPACIIGTITCHPLRYTMPTLTESLNALRTSDALAEVITTFNKFRDAYSDAEWDQLQDKPHIENLLDALVELEYQFEHQPE